MPHLNVFYCVCILSNLQNKTPYLRLEIWRPVLPFVWMQHNQAAVSSLAHLLSVQNYIDLEVLRLLMQKLGLLPVLLQF